MGGASQGARVRTPLRLLLVALVTFSAAGCQAILDPEVPPTSAPTPVRSGIRGVVNLGPTCEGATRASPCIEAYSADLVLLDADDQVVARVTSGADGRFEVTVPPGVYTIQPVPPANGDQFPAGRTVTVIVGEEAFTEIGVEYDTGIR